MNARVSIPADPHERRRLWREWIHMDTPAVEDRQRPTVRRVEAAESHPKQTDWLPDVIDAPEGVIHGLKRAISECLVGGTLPIADRERLITRSLKLGLNRFEANLLIAAVQNRHRVNPTLPPVEIEPRRRWSLLQILGLALAVEATAFVAFIRIYF